MTKEPSTAVDVLVKARGLIEVGWAKGRSHRIRKGVDCYCALGALKASTDDSELWHSAYNRLLSVIPMNNALSEFNDRSPNKNRVLAAFDRAIEAEQELLG